jgi:hypothetical protein
MSKFWMRALRSLETSGSDYPLTQRHIPKRQKHERQCIFPDVGIEFVNSFYFIQCSSYPPAKTATCHVWPDLLSTGKTVRYSTYDQPTIFGLRNVSVPHIVHKLSFHSLLSHYQLRIAISMWYHRDWCHLLVADHVFLVSELPAYIIRCCFLLIRRVVNNH